MAWEGHLQKISKPKEAQGTESQEAAQLGSRPAAWVHLSGLQLVLPVLRASLSQRGA